MPRPSSKTRAFTLIELLIVVAMMALLAAVIVPFVLSKAQSTTSATADIAQAPPNLTSLAAGDRELDPPRILSSTVAVTLSVTPVLEDSAVHARYLASFRGTFRVAPIDPAAEELTLFFPFPPGATELREVSLRLGPEEIEPAEAHYASDGIRWRGRVKQGEELIARVSYRALGRDTFSYDIAGKRRSGRVLFTVDVEGGRAIVPARSLEPESVAPERVVWGFDKMISARPIVLELPSGSSPLGRAIALLRLAALAVLIFGSGYWYLGEGKSPGWLDGFRWSHFLLLALNYSLYFAVTAVLSFWISPWQAAAAGALFSLPLLVLHVARIADLRFALARALPLAVFTLGITVLAVFLEEKRSLILLGAAVAVIAYLTLSYRAWIAGRRAYRAAKTKEAERKTAERSAKDALERLAQAIDKGEVVRRAAEHALEEAPRAPDLELERSALDEVLARWNRAVTAAHPRLQEQLGRELLERIAKDVEDERAVAERIAAELTAAEDAFRRALAAAKERRLRQRAVRAKSEGESAKDPHCAACGSHVAPAARYCGKCGVARPSAIECDACGTRLRLPAQVLRKDWSHAALFCEGCGSCVRAGELVSRA